MPELRSERFHDPRTGFSGWRVRLGAGRGIPTPAVVGGRVVFGGGFGSHEIYAIDVRTAALAWQLRTRDDGPTAATVTDGVVLLNTESCTLIAIELATGRALWEKWLGDPLLAQPAASKDRIFMVYPHAGSHMLGSFDLRTGDPRWSIVLGHDVITAPVLADDAVYVTTYDGAVTCIDAASGRLRWTEMMHATSAPWVFDGKVYVAQRNRPDSSTSPGPTGTESTVSRPVEPAAAAQAARERTAAFMASTGAAAGEFTTDFKDAPYLRQDWGSLRKQQFAATDAAVGFAHAPAAAKLEGVSSLIGEQYVSRAWRFQGSRPVVRDGVLFETTGDVLEARAADTRRVLWSWNDARLAEGERRLTTPAVSNGRVLAGTWDGRILSWDATDGRLRWEVSVGAPCHWQPVMSEGRVVAGLEDGSVVAFETGDSGDDGWAMWGGGAGHNG